MQINCASAHIILIGNQRVQFICQASHRRSDQRYAGASEIAVGT